MLAFDSAKFSKDVTSRFKRGTKTQAAAAEDIGCSSSTLGGILRGNMPSLEVALSVCQWMKKDINIYAKEGLAHGLQARWTAKHPDGRTVIIEHGKGTASIAERDTSGRLLNKQVANYGNGGAARYFEEFRERYTGLDFVETEHLTA